MNMMRLFDVHHRVASTVEVLRLEIGNFDDVDLHAVVKHASIKVSCDCHFGEFDALLWVWSVQELDPGHIQS